MFKIPYIVIYVPFLNYGGMALFPFILIKYRHYRYNEFLIHHEKIHLQQQLELLILPFYILYALNYLGNRFKYPTHDQAYRNICFEREAYTHEYDLEYLKNRPLWSFWRYL
ncbi:MAG: hypothetical protein MUE85_23750 [Microscillaceae bacterium]|jgi:hypothetical protein|nr:hypothetical protein [Microscillaceae bacterium]